MKWISVKEKYPDFTELTHNYELSKEVLIYSRIDNIIMGKYVMGRVGDYKGKFEWWKSSDEYPYLPLSAVSHWMPLPQRPKAQVKSELE